jgi:Ran-binding protein 1
LIALIHIQKLSIIRRAKLFTFGENMLDKGTGKKSWNEKGTGDVKFLK